MGYSSQTAKAFIQEIAPYAQEAYKTLGKVKPSVCIAMAIVESAAGTSKIMRSHNAYFGQKVGTGKTATKYWTGTFFTSQTSEEYTVGTHTIIKAAFRSFPNMRLCVFNFYELLNSSVYKIVQADTDYKTQMQQIKKAGYMTSSTEVSSVLGLIGKYDLTKYDNVGTVTLSDAELTEIAKKVIAGEYGNGEMRKSRLRAEGYDYEVIQKKVNELLKG